MDNISFLSPESPFKSNLLSIFLVLTRPLDSLKICIIIIPNLSDEYIIYYTERGKA